MTKSEMRHFAAIAKEQGIIIEVTEAGRTIRFYPDTIAHSTLAEEEDEVDRAITAFERKHGVL